MVRTRFVPAVETPNGILTSFTTQTSYLAGTLRVLISGRFLDASLDNGFVEGVAPAFEMKVAPRATETLWTFYREA